MKLELFNNETVSLWKKMSSGATTNRPNIELELYKKLLNFFQVGDYYYYIFNIKDIAFDLVSPQVETVLGYTQSEFDIPSFMDKIHTNDRPWFLRFETKTAEFLLQLHIEKLMRYKLRYDFRVRKKNGKLFSIIILLENLSKFLLPLGLFWLILCLFIYLFDLFPCWLSGQRSSLAI